MRLHHYTITEYNGATLRQEGADYVMRSPGSVHRLLVSATNVERLTVHWQGFSGWKGEAFEIAGAGRAARKANREAVERLENRTDAELFSDRTADGFRPAPFLNRAGGLAAMRRAIGRVVMTRPNCGWSRFVVVGIARDGKRLRVRRLRTGDGRLNQTITLLDPARVL